MIEDRNIICFASNWFYDPTSKHHVMKLLSRHNHVIWVNYHASRRPQLSSADLGGAVAKLRQFVQGPRRVTPNITVVTPLVLPIPGNRAVAALNRELLTRQIWSVLRNLPDRPAQLWSFAPDVDYLCGRFDEECVVYYCVDEFSQFSGYDASAVAAAEERLIRRADLVVTTSQALHDAKQAVVSSPRRRSRASRGPSLSPPDAADAFDVDPPGDESRSNRQAEVVLVPHGVDYDHFAQATSPDTIVPADIADLPKPILGFWGLIQDWLDLDLLADVARARPDWSIVLIGEALADTSALSDLPNAHLLDRRPYRSLPDYAKGFDLGLIPFRINSLTRAVNPIKLREYLSAGLPVVSTPLPEVQRYRNLVRIADSPSDFVAVCEHTLAEEKSDGARLAAARQAAMRHETWEAKVEELSDHVRRNMRTGLRFVPAPAPTDTALLA